MDNFDFVFEGNNKDYKKMSADMAWLLENALDKGIKELRIKVTEGEEENYIRGLVADVFSESEVDITIG